MGSNALQGKAEAGGHRGGLGPKAPERQPQNGYKRGQQQAQAPFLVIRRAM